MTDIGKRAILFDTETTGLDPEEGHRILEIAALELHGDVPTGEKYHVVIDPERDIPAEATKVHGFTSESVAGKPKFADIADGFLEFIQDSPLIAHNASFDMKFLNAELGRVGRKQLSNERVIDTLLMARKAFPGMPASLDSLCRRFNIDLSQRGQHNALLDCKLLAEVYLELRGGRQRGFEFVVESKMSRKNSISGQTINLEQRVARPMMQVSEEEKSAHDAFVSQIKNAIWNA